MNLRSPAHGEPIRTERLRLLARRATLLLLLITVPGLSTLAKKSWYLPPSNPGHYLTVASKMNVARPAAVFDATPLQGFASIVLPRPQTRTRLPIDATPFARTMGATISPQRRPPPSFAA